MSNYTYEQPTGYSEISRELKKLKESQSNDNLDKLIGDVDYLSSYDKVYLEKHNELKLEFDELVTETDGMKEYIESLENLLKLNNIKF